MDERTARKSDEAPGNEKASGSSSSEAGGIEKFLNAFIQQIEFVSKHFNYTEEYVLEHTPDWLNRKFKQAQKEQFENHNRKVLEGFQSALLVLDSVFNKGKEFNKILPPTIEAAMEQSRIKQEIESKFVTGQWWKSAPSEIKH